MYGSVFDNEFSKLLSKKIEHRNKRKHESVHKNEYIKGQYYSLVFWTHHALKEQLMNYLEPK